MHDQRHWRIVVILEELDGVHVNPVLSLLIHGWFIAASLHRRSHLEKSSHQWIRECPTEDLVHIAQIPKRLEPQWSIYSKHQGLHPDITDLASQMYLDLLACTFTLEQKMTISITPIESQG